MIVLVAEDAVLSVVVGAVVVAGVKVIVVVISLGVGAVTPAEVVVVCAYG